MSRNRDRAPDSGTILLRGTATFHRLRCDQGLARKLLPIEHALCVHAQTGKRAAANALVCK